MDRRRFVRIGLLSTLAGGVTVVAGCTDETKQTGGLVETPADDLKSMEASAKAYEEMDRARGIGKKPQ